VCPGSPFIVPTLIQSSDVVSGPSLLATNKSRPIIYPSPFRTCGVDVNGNSLLSLKNPFIVMVPILIPPIVEPDGKIIDSPNDFMAAPPTYNVLLEIYASFT